MSRDGRRPSEDRPPIIGPYGTRTWTGKRWLIRLTPEGEAELSRWLADQYPVPAKLLHKRHKGLIRDARRFGIDDDELHTLCWLGAHRAMAAWEPQRGFKFSTYAYAWIMNHVVRAVDRAGRLDRSRLGVVSGHTPLSRDGNGGAILDGVPDRETLPTVPDFTARVAVALDAIADPHLRQIGRLHFGLEGEPLTITEIAQLFGTPPGQIAEAVDSIRRDALRGVACELADRVSAVATYKESR